MPVGIGRPYNKDVRTIAKAKKKLKATPLNKTVIEDDSRYGASSGKRGNAMGLSEPSDDALFGARWRGRDMDELKAAEMRKSDRSKYAK